MQKTPLYKNHLKLNAKMIDFGGWLMPVQYTNLIEEHLATRTKAGLFDICHMGEFMISGKEAQKFLQYALTNDLNKLVPGKCFYSALCNEKAGIVDDLFVYCFSAEKYMLVVNAANIAKDFEHLQKYACKFDVRLEDRSANTAKVDLQGPNSEKILQKVLKTPLEITRFSFLETKLYDIDVLISRTGYTGEDGFELYFKAEYAPLIWEKLLAEGKEQGLTPVGLGARDTLRIEASYSLYGHELTEKTSPIEAGIGFVVKPKETNFIAKNILLAQKQNGAPQNMICFEMIERAVPRDGYDIYYQNAKIGAITSGTFSPLMKKGIGLGLIKQKLEIGTEVEINIRGKNYKAKIVPRPFYKILK
ncbi:glycine cleavage system aminomethyltransferase GcvT [Candidatus Margulisiibacteriota bacterium]